MLFNSLEFLLLFLPLVLFVAFRLKGSPLLVWIAATSFVFYAFAGHAWFIIPMAITTASANPTDAPGSGNREITAVCSTTAVSTMAAATKTCH